MAGGMQSKRADLGRVGQDINKRSLNGEAGNYFWLVGLFNLYFFKRENIEKFKQNKCRQITAFRRDRNYKNQKIKYFKLLAFLLGAGGVRKYHHYYFPAQVQDWLVRQCDLQCCQGHLQLLIKEKFNFFSVLGPIFHFFIILFHFYTEYSAKLPPDAFKSCN